MASNEARLAPISPSSNVLSSQSLAHQQPQHLTSLSPVEMSRLTPAHLSAAPGAAIASPAPVQAGPYSQETTHITTLPQSQLQPVPNTTTSLPPADSLLPLPAARVPAAVGSAALSENQQRPLAESAIGPSFDGAIMASTDEQADPAVLITLLLITGARHPYTIDQKYLRRRNVAAATEEIDPFSISVYTMKELIWRDWREGEPTSP